MLIIGLTGGIGSGKTEVSKMFSDLGVAVIDTDIIAHKLTEEDSSVLKKIIDKFGARFLLDKRHLNRKLLSQTIFNNEEKRQSLESILHPEIEKSVKQELLRLSNTNTPYVVIVVPLLFETSFKEMVDKTLVIDSNESDQIARTKTRDNKDISEIENIMKHQLSRDERLKYADDTLSNTGTLQELKIAAKTLHEKYLSTDIQ